MTYSSSLGQSGLGAVLSIGGVASGSATYVPIGEVDDVGEFLPEWKLTDTTNLQSTMEEMKPVILQTSKASLSGNRVSPDAGQTECLTAYNGNPPVPYWFKLVFPINTAAGQSTAGDQWVFTAYVTKAAFKEIKPTEWIKFAIDLTVVSKPVYTQGS